jgi:DNA-directed RNA polymerase specialized sigma24 family protein
MMGAASRNLPEPSAREYVGRVFSQHREELEWLANFLTGDETIAAACLVDACALAESETPRFQEWILKCASLATIRSAVQIQQRRIVQLSFAHKQRPCIHGGHTALSSDWCEILVEEPSVVIARLDVLCRSALVICGLERRSAYEAAALLGIDPAGVEGAYCAAIESLEVIRCEQFQQQNDSAAVYN